MKKAAALSSEFWVACPPMAQRKYADWDDGGRRVSIVRCPINPDHGSYKYDGTLKVVVNHNKLGDFIYTWGGGGWLISDNARKRFSSERITGITTLPMEVRYKRPPHEVKTKYWELKVAGWGGVASLASGMKQVSYCSTCGIQDYSYHNNPAQLVDLDRWDGSDIFNVWPLTKKIIITKRVVEVINANKLEGFLLMPIADMKHVAKEYHSAGLRYHYPEKRARELGVPLGIY